MDIHASILTDTDWIEIRISLLNRIREHREVMAITRRVTPQHMPLRRQRLRELIATYRRTFTAAAIADLNQQVTLNLFAAA